VATSDGELLPSLNPRGIGVDHVSGEPTAADSGQEVDLIGGFDAEDAAPKGRRDKGLRCSNLRGSGADHIGGASTVANSGQVMPVERSIGESIGKEVHGIEFFPGADLCGIGVDRVGGEPTAADSSQVVPIAGQEDTAMEFWTRNSRACRCHGSPTQPTDHDDGNACSPPDVVSDVHTSFPILSLICFLLKILHNATSEEWKPAIVLLSRYPSLYSSQTYYTCKRGDAHQ